MSDATSTAATTAPKKKRGKSVSDVAKVFLLKGLEPIKAFLADGLASKDTVRHAMKEMEKDGLEADKLKPLKDFYASLATKQQRGLKAGEEYDYKAQATKSSPHPFIKLPLWHGAQKGDKVRVRMSAANEPTSVWARPVTAGEAPAKDGEVDVAADGEDGQSN